MNIKTKETIEKLEGMPMVVNYATAASVLHIGARRFKKMLEAELPPYAIETTIPGEESRHFKVYTERLIQWLKGEQIFKVG